MNKKYLLTPLILVGLLALLYFWREDKRDRGALITKISPSNKESIVMASIDLVPNATRNPASAADVPTDSKMSVEDRLTRFLGAYNKVEFHFDRNPVTGQVIGVSQGLFDLNRTSPPISKDEFIGGIAESFGVEARAMQKSSQQPGQTDLTDVLTFKQHMGEYEVMDAFVKLHTSKQTGLVYYINSELYPIPEGWTPDFKVTSEQAYSNLVTNFKDDNVTISIDPRPIVFPFDKGHIELVWVVDVRGNDERSAKNDRRLFYGAESGQIRQEVSLRSH